MHKRHTTPALFPRPLTLALSAALPALFAQHLSHAACNGTVSTPNSASTSILCNNAGATTSGNVTASDQTTYVDATNAGIVPGTPVTTANILMQFDGHGRTLSVGSGGTVANYRNVAAARTAVTMGASTVNAAASTVFTAAPADGATTVAISGTPATSWVGQSIVIGRWLQSDGGDFAPGTSYVIDAVDVANKTVTLKTPLSANFAGSGTDTMVYSVVSNYGVGTTRSWSGANAALFGKSTFYNNVINNAGLIASRVQASEMSTSAASATNTPYAQSIYGIRTSVAGNYLIDNAGTIRVSHAGIGAAYGVEEGGTVLRMDVRNTGQIEALRAPAVSLTAVTATGNPTGTSGGFAFSAATVALVNAINTQEEAEVLNVLNTGTIRTQGDYTGTFYMRAAEKNIVNYGLIEHVSSAGGASYNKGFAIGSVSNGGEIRELQLANQRGATINGDILAVNGNALRWYLLSTETTLAANGRDTRLTINSHTGQENSEIANAGTIRGNIWLSNGTHALANTGTLTGNIDVDQRDTTYTSGTASGTATTIIQTEGENTNNTLTNGNQYTIRGDKAFSFVNTGTVTGNITLTNASSTFTPTGGSATTARSQNTLVNAGTLTGNIVLSDVTADSRNGITLLSDGFTGTITATRKTGVNALEAASVLLNLGGSGTLRGDVSGVSTLNVGGFTLPAGDDDDAVALPRVGNPNWTIASGKTVQADAALINKGSLMVAGTLQAPITIASGATLAGNGTVTGAVTNAGIINAGAGTLSVTGNVTMQSGSILKATVDANNAAGKLAVTGTLDFASGSSVRPVAASGFRITHGAQYTLASATSMTGTPTLLGNGLVSWQSSVANNQLTATATVNTASVANLSTGATTALNKVVGIGGALAERVMSLDSEAAVQKAAEQLKPDVKGSNVVGAMAAGSAVSGVIDGRSSGVQIASLLRQSRASGVSTGEAIDGGGLWFQAFGFTGEQQARGGQDGYGVNSGGITVGADQLVDARDGLRVGAAFSYASSTVGSQTGINSYQGTLYASRELGAYYVSGEVGMGRHEYASNRTVVGEIAHASYAGTQYGGKVEAGMPLQTEIGALVPIASLSASRLNFDGYTETGATGALSVDASQISSLRSGLGAKWLLPLADAAAGSALELRAMWSHEFGDARFDTTSKFVAGGSSFKTTGVEQERDSLSTGAAFKWSATAGGVRQSLSFGYGAEIKRGYLSHTGYVQGRVDF